MRFFNLLKEDFNHDTNTAKCNLFKACKSLNRFEISNGKFGKTIDFLSQKDHCNQDTTLVTHSGDWGIKSRDCNISKRKMYNYTIEDATHGGAFIPLEIQSIASGFRRWFTTNQTEPLFDNIHPIPININYNLEDDEISSLRSTEKTNTCWANFSITSPYRIRVAEWAWTQRFIDCNFPKQYETQDIELNMPILKGTELPRADYLQTLSSYHFCIAPPGNGWDTFRTWECILCNTVPVVRDSFMNRVFSSIWPMVVIDRYEFNDVHEKLMNFFSFHGQQDYDYSLLLEENFDELLDRLEYESNRIRREAV